MPDDPQAQPTSPTTSRPKASRSNTTGTVRARGSSPPPTGEGNSDGRPPTKRARKAINCEPCRNSKLKCDRNRPCSSCVLRGTSASCYQDGRGPEGSDPLGRGDDHSYTRVDPAQEIARLRHSISLLEAYVFPAHRNQTQAHRRASDAASLIVPKKENTEADGEGKSAAPGMLGSQVQGGLYAGPTSAATHLLINDKSGDSDEGESRHHSQDRTDDFPGTVEYDRDLLAMLPSLEVIDGLISHYFDYCNWIYRHINQPAFTAHWERFKSGTSADRLTLSAACIMMAIAVQYLPQQHHLLENFHESHEELGQRFYEVSSTALQRRLSETRAYSLELVELLLCRSHYLTLSKTDSEEIWHVRGELITIGMAMGLHRDPGKWRMHRDVAERRRWAWWHIILLERWQAFMFGRPLAIASHHFDTQLPSYCDPSVDKTGRLYLPNIALFRLAFILSDIMDDAVSVRSVPYENVQANDRALQQWMENLPPELDLDEYRVARSLASSNLSTRRLGVQSVIIRTSYYHIRFSLHRPYASANPNVAPTSSSANNKSSNISPERQAQSLEIAVGAADKLITMVGQSRPDFLANSALAVPGHMNWGPFHCFSAAMFFSFQLISNPEQPGAGLFRQSIRKAITTIESSRGTPLSDKAFAILSALTPLYSPEFSQTTPEERDKLRAQKLGVVKKLAFPYHDSHDPRRYGESPSARGTVGSPANSSSLSPPAQMISALPQQYESIPSHAMSSMRTGTNMYPPQQTVQTHLSSVSESPQPHPQMVTHPQSLAGVSTSYSNPNPSSYMSQGQVYGGDPQRYMYVHPVDEATMWGAAVGFGQSEWTQFLDGFKPEVQASNGRQIVHTT